MASRRSSARRACCSAQSGASSCRHCSSVLFGSCGWRDRTATISSRCAFSRARRSTGLRTSNSASCCFMVRKTRRQEIRHFAGIADVANGLGNVRIHPVPESQEAADLSVGGPKGFCRWRRRRRYVSLRSDAHARRKGTARCDRVEHLGPIKAAHHDLQITFGENASPANSRDGSDAGKQGAPRIPPSEGHVLRNEEAKQVLRADRQRYGVELRLRHDQGEALIREDHLPVDRQQGEDIGNARLVHVRISNRYWSGRNGRSRRLPPVPSRPRAEL